MTATLVLDGRELVVGPRRADHLLEPRPDNHRPYPQIDRRRARAHGLYLVHHPSQYDGDYHGDLLVTGDRLTQP